MSIDSDSATEKMTSTALGTWGSFLLLPYPSISYSLRPRSRIFCLDLLKHDLSNTRSPPPCVSISLPHQDQAGDLLTSMFLMPSQDLPTVAQ